MPYPDMNPQAYLPGPEASYGRPDTPLSAYAPGNLAKLSPAERARMLKRTKKGQGAAAALMSPPTPLSGEY